VGYDARLRLDAPKLDLNDGGLLDGLDAADSDLAQFFAPLLDGIFTAVVR
jgi:hypothetical protein